MKIEWERPKTPSFSTPQSEMVDALNLEPGNIVLEYGTGSGRYTLSIARKLERLSGDGIVFAADIKKRTLERLDDRAIRQDLDHRIRLLPVTERAERKLPIMSEGVDRLLTVDMDFQSAKTPSLTKELLRVLKPGGMLLIGATPNNAFRKEMSPQVEAETAARALTAAGFRTIHLMRPEGTAWAIAAS